MAKYYSLVYSSFAADFKAALEDYYGDGVTVESASGQTIEFSCPQICDKPLYISNGKPLSSAPTYVLVGKCGDVTFQSSNEYSSKGSVEPYHLILSDDFLLLQLVDSVSVAYSTTILVAKTTNGRFLCMGGSGVQGNKNYGVCQFTDEVDNRPVWFMTPCQKPFRTAKKIPIFKSHFAIGGEMELNDDGTFAYIDGLYLTGEKTAGGIVGLNYFLSNDSVGGNSTNGVYMPNAFYVDIDLE